jgi:O-acetyl-ADP-ribose deacetylase (regulator of RNase III)
MWNRHHFSDCDNYYFGKEIIYMTITFKTGNILDATENLICQQVNYQGKMGSGLAKQIIDRWPNILDDYREFIHHYSWNEIRLGGRFHKFKISENPIRKIGNIFGQEYYGRNKVYTDYLALKNGLLNARAYSEWCKYSIALPWKIGCGLAGGDWEGVVYPMIEEIFGQSEVQCVIYKLEE